MLNRFLPPGRQSISDADIEAVVEVLRSEHLTTGPYADRFERDLAEATGAAEAVVCANGAAALHLAALTQDLGPEDVVIVPSMTFAGSANGIAYCGAQVIFADVDPQTGLITDATFDDALNLFRKGPPRYRYAGVIPVHYAGRPVGLGHIRKTSEELGGFVIEDACHAIGTTGPDGRVGACQASDMAVFSFHPVTTITAGEGGAITTNDAERARRLRLLRSQGVERDSARFDGLGFRDDNDTGHWVYEMQALGFDYGLPDTNCALGISQLRRLPEFAVRRKRLVRLYQDALAGANLPVHWTPTRDSAVFDLFAVSIDFAALGTTRTRVMQGLRNRGIGTQVHYIPVHRQPYWQSHALGVRDLPGADHYYRNTLSLPLFADMADGDPARVIEALSEVLQAL